MHRAMGGSKGQGRSLVAPELCRGTRSKRNTLLLPSSVSLVILDISTMASNVCKSPDDHPAPVPLTPPDPCCHTGRL